MFVSNSSKILFSPGQGRKLVIADPLRCRIVTWYSMCCPTNKSVHGCPVELWRCVSAERHEDIVAWRGTHWPARRRFLQAGRPMRGSSVFCQLNRRLGSAQGIGCIGSLLAISANELRDGGKIDEWWPR